MEQKCDDTEPGAWWPDGALPELMMLTLSDSCHKMITGEQRKQILCLTRKCNKSSFPETQNYDTWKSRKGREGRRGRRNWKITFVNKFSNLETTEIKFVFSHLIKLLSPSIKIRSSGYTSNPYNIQCFHFYSIEAFMEDAWKLT